MRAPADHDRRSTSPFLLAIALLWLAGNGLRITILAVPPVIPLIRTDLGMSETEVGILTGLPPVLFALAAVPGSLLIARIGALSTLIAGLLATALGSALRGSASNVIVLYAMTVLTAFGVAIMQPALPALVRSWLPNRIGFGTAVYTNGLLIGEIFPVALTIPVLLPLLDNSWRWSFVVWALPVVVIAVVIAVLAPRKGTSGAPVVTAGRRWWPDWRDGLIWRIGIMLGAANAMYFSANAFLPDYLHYIGRPDLVSAGLTALNGFQILASLPLLLVAGRLERRAWPYVACGGVSLLAVIGIATLGGVWIVVCAGVLGWAASATLILALALPPLISAPDDVHRTSAAMFTISYSVAVIVPVISGLIWDLSGIGQAAFIPIGLCAFLLAALAPTIRANRD